MAGINFSHTNETGVKPKFFDTGIIVALALLVLVLGVFGGLRWYIGSLEKQNSFVENVIAEKNGILQGEEVDRLADVENRLAHLEGNAPEDSKVVFEQLERSIIPAVALTKFEYHKNGGVMILTATAPNFKVLAQQIQTLKETGAFSDLQMREIGRNEEGRISFTVASTMITSLQQ